MNSRLITLYCNNIVLKFSRRVDLKHSYQGKKKRKEKKKSNYVRCFIVS